MINLSAINASNICNLPLKKKVYIPLVLLNSKEHRSQKALQFLKF